MLRHDLKTALRVIGRHKGYSAINILGLAAGMTCGLLIFLWVRDEWSYDRFHENAEKIFRVEFDQIYSSGLFHVGVTPYPLGPAVTAEVPDVSAAARVARPGPVLFRRGDRMTYEDDAAAVDPSFLEVFSFPLERGRAETALADIHSIVLSEALAAKYFPDEDPLGKTINLYHRWDMTVTGVLEKIPSNSSLRLSCLIPFDVLPAAGTRSDDWQGNSIHTYVLLGAKGKPETATANIQAVVRAHHPRGAPDQVYSLKPLTRLRLFSRSGFDRSAGLIKYVTLFSLVAFAVLVIACINFMNLSTARSGRRAREIGVRKTVGAVKSRLVRQFYTESMVQTLLALVLAAAAVFLPFFNRLAGKEIVLQAGDITEIAAGLLGIAAVTGLLAGGYPALVLAAFRPARVLKGTAPAGRSNMLFRRILVVFQFAVSVSLLIGTGTVVSQLEFMRTRDPGYDKDNILTVSLRGNTRDCLEALKAELLTSPAVRAVTASGELPSAIYSNTSGVSWAGKDPEDSISFSMLDVDYDFLRTMRLTLLEGRDFSPDHQADRALAVIINDRARGILGKPNVVGDNLTIGNVESVIVGVVDDFHFQSLREDVEPLFMSLERRRLNHLLVGIRPGAVSPAVRHLEKAWRKIVPDDPLEFGFLDGTLEDLYVHEDRLGKILGIFAGLAVVIACLGLFGLASCSAERRIREVGIRKVLGASIPRILILLGREHVVLVLAANLVAWPLMFAIMNVWLRGFAYRTAPNPLTFAAATGAALLAAFVSVGHQAIRAAAMNPAVSLKHE